MPHVSASARSLSRCQLYGSSPQTQDIEQELDSAHFGVKIRILRTQGIVLVLQSQNPLSQVVNRLSVIVAQLGVVLDGLSLAFGFLGDLFVIGVSVGVINHGAGREVGRQNTYVFNCLFHLFDRLLEGCVARNMVNLLYLSKHLGHET